jgi:CubicO group peptidase (beta-lactamase class C family)
MDAYLRDRLFLPLGITDLWWSDDAVGSPYCMAGLQIRPSDLAKIGEMLADGGLWRGKRIISKAWIEASALKPSQELEPSYGLLWWLVGGKEEMGPIIDEEGLAKLRKAGVNLAFIEKAATLKGLAPHSQGERQQLIKKLFGPEGLTLWMKEVIGRGIRPRIRRLSPPTGFEARGYLGQYLLVLPKDKLVVVRMHRRNSSDNPSSAASPSEFFEFHSLAAALVP